MAGAQIGIGDRATRDRMGHDLDRALDDEIDIAVLAGPLDDLIALAVTLPPTLPFELRQLLLRQRVEQRNSRQPTHSRIPPRLDTLLRRTDIMSARRRSSLPYSPRYRVIRGTPYHVSPRPCRRCAPIRPAPRFRIPVHGLPRRRMRPRRPAARLPPDRRDGRCTGGPR